MTPTPSAAEVSLRARIETAHVGIVLTLASGLGLFAYVALTWSQPHRDVGAVLATLACASSIALALSPLDRLLSERWAPVTWLAWSLSLVVTTAVGVALDEGTRSPLVLVFVLMLMFAALSYPRRIALIVCAADLIACLVSLQLAHAGAAYTMLSLVVLTGAAGLCLWQVRRQERQERRLARLSRTDFLTNCLNRRAFADFLQAAFARYARSRTTFALVIVDLDDFKAVNDRFGHAAGDELLRWTAASAAASLRPGDTLARLGGDEFAVILPGLGATEADAACARLVAALAPRSPATAGFACCPADGTDEEALYRAADARLYAAKRLAKEAARTSRRGALTRAAGSP